MIAIQSQIDIHSMYKKQKQRLYLIDMLTKM